MLWIEVGILIVFNFEVCLKFFAIGTNFLKDWANVFDILIVCSCFILAILELKYPELEDL